jgi:hypothetical protein
MGTSCNFFLQSYEMDTNNALLPIDNIEVQVGGTSNSQAISSTYPVNLNLSNSTFTFFKFYLRKSPLNQLITRSFQKLD